MPLHLPKVRSDLEYFDQEIEGEDVVVVSDPVRGAYFKYNLLQAAMLRKLDGRRTLEQMTAELSKEFDVEIPKAAAERFIAHAQKQMLLDVSSFAVSDSAAKKQVFKALKKIGFRFRGVSKDEGASTRVASSEAVLFMGGLRHLQNGSPAKALDFFQAVLELNPKNARAKTLASTIQSAYVKALSGSTTDFPTFALFNPTRLLRLLDRTIGRVGFNWIGATLLFVLMILAVYSFSITSYPAIHVGPLDFVLIVVFSTLDVLIHELGHGLACHHYGGRVPEIGVTLFYWVRPVPYCDTSSSYLFKRRRQKIIVQAYGTLVTLAYVCVLVILLAVMQQDLFLYTPMLVIMWIALFSLFINIFPFIKLDGYFALCDYMNVPNLRERSINLFKAWARYRVLGLPAVEEPLPSRKRRLFFIFAVLSIVFTAAWMYYAMFRLLAPIVERYRGIGLIVAATILFYQLRIVVIRPLRDLARLVIAQRHSIFTPRRTVTMLAVAAIVVAPWAYPTAVRADAGFVLVPSQRAEVRAKVPGIVSKILVHEGEHVVRDQPLAILRSDDLELRTRTLEADLAGLDARIARLRALFRPEEIAVARQRMEQMRATAALDRYRAKQATLLASNGVGTSSSANVAAGAAAVTESLTTAAQQQLEMLEQGARPEAIVAAEADRERVLADLEHVKHSSDLLTVRSPIDGVVVAKHLEDRLYMRLEQGDKLVEVHDLVSQYAEIELSPFAPLAELAPGDRVVLRPVGAPTAEITTTIANVRTTLGPGGVPKHVVVTDAFDTPLRVTGMSGHARLYGREHSLAYGELYLPLARLFSVELWSMLM